MELVVLSLKQSTARCRLLDRDRVLTLRPSDLWNVVPGHIITVRPRKQWRYARHPYLSGRIEQTRLDIPALNLVPLQLEDCGMWDPEQEYQSFVLVHPLAYQYEQDRDAHLLRF